MLILGIVDYDYFKDNYIYISKKIEKYVHFLWFRIKNIEEKIIAEKAKILRDNVSCSLVLSNNPYIANKYNYQGVHLNIKTYHYFSEIRNKYPALKIGYSAHSIEEINNITSDYYTLSPIFHTDKPYIVNPLGITKIISKKDVYALGGINKSNYKLLTNMGFKGVAGIKLLKELPL